MNNSTVVYARDLRKAYGRKQALRGIDLDIGTGSIIGLVGPNGAGKTTALKAMLGLAGFQGELSVLGLHPLRQRNELMRQVAFIADVATLPRWIRVQQLLELVDKVHPNFSMDECRNYLQRTEIGQRDRVKTLSKGMVVQLHLALVMAIDARLLVLDEPTLGLDILFRKQFYAHLLDEYFDGERTIIITTHQVEEIEHILTHLLFIRHGNIVLDNTMDEVQQRFSEVMVTPDNAERARALGPMHERQVFGRHMFLFENQPGDKLEALGEVHTPSIADLFVATMQEPQA